jgi:hypothetical protein
MKKAVPALPHAPKSGILKCMLIKIDEAALKHGVVKEDIHCALATVLFDSLLPKFFNKYLLIGFGRNGNLLEIMYNIGQDESVNVFHAMKCRKEFYHFLERG